MGFFDKVSNAFDTVVVKPINKIGKVGEEALQDIGQEVGKAPTAVTEMFVGKPVESLSQSAATSLETITPAAAEALPVVAEAASLYANPAAAAQFLGNQKTTASESKAVPVMTSSAQPVISTGSGSINTTMIISLLAGAGLFLYFMMRGKK